MQPRGDRPVIISFRLEHLLGWSLTFVICLIPVYFWLQLHPLSTIQTFPAIMLAIGRVTGLIGMAMYALNLVYATRLRFLEYLFGGLNRVYIAHHLLGGLALIFLSFHPLFLALRYVQTSLLQAALLLLPNGIFPLSGLFNRHADLHAAILDQWAIFFGIIAFWGMVILLLVTFFVRIPYRWWLFTHKFLGVAFFFGGLHVLFISSDTTADAKLKYYLLALTLMGLAAYTYRTLFGKIIIRKYKYAIQEVQLLGGNVTHIVMRAADHKLSHRPGQFVFVRFLDAGSLGVTNEWHPFSISSSPDDNMLRLSVKGLGDYTSTLGKLQPGIVAEIEGAYGRFGYSYYKNKNQVWIAGGIGITPFLSMASSLPGEGYHIDLFYSVKTASELIDWETLTAFSVMKENTLRIHPYIGDRETGHLSAEYIQKICGDMKNRDIFICGPPPMMKSLRKQFKDLAIPGTSIHSEEFGMS